MLRFTPALCCLTLCAPVLAQDTPAATPPATPPLEKLPDGAELHRRLVERYRPMYEKYIGVETKARSETKMWDTETNELKETSVIVAVGRDYFYKDREATFVEYTKNGEKQDPEDADKWGGDKRPMVAIWDKDGPKNYRIEVLDRSVMARQQCYVLKVIPKEETDKHFAGTVYVNVDTLDVIYMDGGMADTPFGVDSMTMRFYLKDHDGVLAATRGTFRAVVDIPILFPDTLMVSKTKTISVRGIPRK